MSIEDQASTFGTPSVDSTKPVPGAHSPNLTDLGKPHVVGNEDYGMDSKMEEGPGGDEGSTGGHHEEEKKEEGKDEGHDDNKPTKKHEEKKGDGNGDDQRDENKKVTRKEANDYHQYPFPGKYQIAPSKPLNSEKDLRLAYVPGVAFPCEEIANNPMNVYKYTTKENTVCVISNGTAVLGLGDIGALASKPVMEGKGVLLKKFGDVNGVDLEVNTKDSDEFINCVKLLGSSYGGINLEDLSGPECFYIESKLKELMDIPVFHDDQHGTAIITAAGVMNACKITDRNLEDLKVVFNGAGAAGIACLQMLLDCGVKKENAILCDSKGVIYKGRTQGMNEWKEKYANDTERRTLEEALNGADVFVGVSAKDALKPEWLKTMNSKPIVFALANPDPEISPEDAIKAVPDVIIATGRSDYPNQVNNVMCFPYLFRGALDVRARNITEKMKVAAAEALAQLAREEVPKEVKDLYHLDDMKFGPEYIIPTPFDPRLLVRVSSAVAQAACKDEGNAMLNYSDWDMYEKYLQKRLDDRYKKF